MSESVGFVSADNWPSKHKFDIDALADLAGNIQHRCIAALKDAGVDPTSPGMSICRFGWKWHNGEPPDSTVFLRVSVTDELVEQPSPASVFAPPARAAFPLLARMLRLKAAMRATTTRVTRVTRAKLAPTPATKLPTKLAILSTGSLLSGKRSRWLGRRMETKMRLRKRESASPRKSVGAIAGGDQGFVEEMEVA